MKKGKTNAPVPAAQTLAKIPDEPVFIFTVAPSHLVKEYKRLKSETVQEFHMRVLLSYLEKAMTSSIKICKVTKSFSNNDRYNVYFSFIGEEKGILEDNERHFTSPSGNSFFIKVNQNQKILDKSIPCIWRPVSDVAKVAAPSTVRAPTLVPVSHLVSPLASPTVSPPASPTTSHIVSHLASPLASPTTSAPVVPFASAPVVPFAPAPIVSFAPAPTSASVGASSSDTFTFPSYTKPSASARVRPPASACVGPFASATTSAHIGAGTFTFGEIY